MPVTGDGTRLSARQPVHDSAAAPVYRRAALRITREFADRYASHPALAMWHVHNEYGPTRCRPSTPRQASGAGCGAGTGTARGAWPR